MSMMQSVLIGWLSGYVRECVTLDEWLSRRICQNEYY